MTKILEFYFKKLKSNRNLDNMKNNEHADFSMVFEGFGRRGGSELYTPGIIRELKLDPKLAWAQKSQGLAAAGKINPFC